MTHTTETTPNAEKIAAGLTEGQRHLLELAATNDYAVTLGWSALYTGPLIKCLKPYDHGKDDCTVAFTVLPLGLALRTNPLPEKADVERVWQALKERCCADAAKAKRCVMVSYDDLAAALASIDQGEG